MPSTPTPAEIESFASSIAGDVVTQSDPSYSTAIGRWAKNAVRRALLVVLVKDPADVSRTIAFAKQYKLPIAIRGGGYGGPGTSSVEGAVVIDLSRYFRYVRVDEEKRLGYVGGGALWGDVDAEAIKYGLATVGGMVHQTGVGGSTLGGGYGWLSGRYGLAIDNLKQVTIVTADGSCLIANETENTDLFWAVRGGGSNFGVVTEFVFQLHPQRRTVFGGHVVYPESKLEKLIEVTKKWWARAKYDGQDEGLTQTATMGPNGKPVMLVFFFFNGSEEEGRANFKEFFDIGAVGDTVTEVPYEHINSVRSIELPQERCYYHNSTSLHEPDYASTVAAFQKLAQIYHEKELTAGLFLEYIPLAKNTSIPVEATAFRRRAAFNAVTLFTWDEDSDVAGKEQRARERATDLVEILIDGAKEDLSDHEKAGHKLFDFDIANPAFGNVEANIESAFGPNYSRLQKVKKQYDPENMFNRWLPITPSDS